MVGLAHKVPLRDRLMTSKACAQSIGDVGRSAVFNLCSILRYVEQEELPVVRRHVEATVPLDHKFGRNQLHDGARRIDTTLW